MILRMSAFVLFLGAIPTVAVAEFDGAKSKWNGFDRYGFTVDGRKCWVVAPQNVAAGRPWIWRARFFGHEPQADIALLNEGFHLAYCDVAGLFGSPQAVKHWNAFYEAMTERYQLAKRPALEGMSRSGLIIYNWAAANADKVACIYGDAPVCDFKSWPGGKGNSEGSGAAWQQCLKAYAWGQNTQPKPNSFPFRGILGGVQTSTCAREARDCLVCRRLYPGPRQIYSFRTTPKARNDKFLNRGRLF